MRKMLARVLRRWAHHLDDATPQVRIKSVDAEVVAAFGKAIHDAGASAAAVANRARRAQA